MTTTPRVLLVGLEPDIVDYSKSPVPGLTAAKVRAAVEADSAKLQSLGYSITSLYVDDGKTAETVLTNALATGGYDLHHDWCRLAHCSSLFPKKHHPPARFSFDEAMLQHKPDRYGRRGPALGLDGVQAQG